MWPASGQKQRQPIDELVVVVHRQNLRNITNHYQAAGDFGKKTTGLHVIDLALAGGAIDSEDRRCRRSWCGHLVLNWYHCRMVTCAAL
jgi:hypothetical protein